MRTPLQFSSVDPALSASRNYRILWRWHFYAGLFVMPFLIALAITGTIYVFKPQIDAALYADKLFVAASTQSPISYDKQLTIAASAVPEEAVATSISVSNNPQRSTEAVFRLASGESTSVYVNPTTGKVLGTLSVEHRIMNQVRQIHRDLMLGKWGGWLMELAACWTLIMLGTGIALWWPRTAFSVRGTLLPRLHLRGRAIWRELHMVVGLWVAIGALFFILTGLPWSSFWGKNFQAIVTWASVDSSAKAAEPEHVHAAEPSAIPMKMRNLPLADIPWAVGATTVPMSHPHVMPPQRLSIDQVAAIAARNGMLTYQLALPTKTASVFTASYAPGASEFLRSDLDRQRTLHIDQYSGKILKDMRFSDYNPVSKAVTLGVALHMGEYFGLANQLICAAISLALLGMAITGFVMWWKRRPARSIGAPKRVLNPPPSIHRWRGFLAVMGILFPMMGVSMLLVWLGDTLFFRKRI
ncbi:PepSY domain-containing protein [Glaciimonas sp. PAMC28666]|uniref:PepSY-associated TM helix domain-containing protein n=1 Tax=Glaciimonas sp. PAMC28666 TaxID=2807626 RepID=UPI001963129F|nr:PepSY domain-containing protein [Glaciimonas sp. PAMC28666]QRX84395.1 PepSY domain-containing protein [Glaciimonas sp. PAMC28666]